MDLDVQIPTGFVRRMTEMMPDPGVGADLLQGRGWDRVATTQVAHTGTSAALTPRGCFLHVAVSGRPHVVQPVGFLELELRPC